MVRSVDIVQREMLVVSETLRGIASRIGIQVDEFAELLIVAEELRPQFQDEWLVKYVELGKQLTQNIALDFVSAIYQSADDVPLIEAADRTYILRELAANHEVSVEHVSDGYCKEVAELLAERLDRQNNGLFLLESDVTRLIAGPFAQPSDELIIAIARQTKLRQLAARYQLPSDRRDLIIILNPDIAREFILEIGVED